MSFDFVNGLFLTTDELAFHMNDCVVLKRLQLKKATNYAYEYVSAGDPNSSLRKHLSTMRNSD